MYSKGDDQTFMLNEKRHTPDQMTAKIAGRRIYIKNMKGILSQGSIPTATSEAKKKPRANNMEDVLQNHLPVYETAF